jgi:hypothetical protein
MKLQYEKSTPYVCSQIVCNYFLYFIVRHYITHFTVNKYNPEANLVREKECLCETGGFDKNRFCVVSIEMENTYHR